LTTTWRGGSPKASVGAEIRLGIDAVGGTASGRFADCLCNDAILVHYGRMSDAPCTVQRDAFVFGNLTMRGLAVAASSGRSGKVLTARRH
jgi:trans-2-enoyl-CoA reductase